MGAFKQGVLMQEMADLCELGVKLQRINMIRRADQQPIDGVIFKTPLLSFYAPIMDNGNGKFAPMPGMRRSEGSEDWIRYVQFNEGVRTAYQNAIETEIGFEKGSSTAWYLDTPILGDDIADFGITKIDYLHARTSRQIDVGVACKLVIHTVWGTVMGVTIFESQSKDSLRLSVPQVPTSIEGRTTDAFRITKEAERAILRKIHADWDFGVEATANRQPRKARTAFNAMLQGQGNTAPATTPADTSASAGGAEVDNFERDDAGNIVYELNEDGTQKLDDSGNPIPKMTQLPF